MPTALRHAGFRFVIFAADHRPAHVHVIGHGGEAVFNLRCPTGPPELREVYGLSRSQVTGARRIVAREIKMLCDAWEIAHGTA
jgi:Domain of unknown function (DUF4160)